MCILQLAKVMKQSCNLEQQRLSHIPWICGPHPWLTIQFTRKFLELFFNLRESDSAALVGDRGLCVKRCPRECDNQQVWESWSQVSVSCRDQELYGRLMSVLKTHTTVLWSEEVLPSRSLYNINVCGKFARLYFALQTCLTTRSASFPHQSTL